MILIIVKNNQDILNQLIQNEFYSYNNANLNITSAESISFKCDFSKNSNGTSELSSKAQSERNFLRKKNKIEGKYEQLLSFYKSKFTSFLILIIK